MIPPTAAQIRSWSKVPLDELVGEAADPDPLEEELLRQEALVQLSVGWFFDPSWLPPTPMFTTNPQLWLIPPIFEPLMRKAIQMAVEWEAYRAQPDAIEGLIDFDTVESFTTRGYSEVRRGHGRGVATFAALQAQVHPWPALAKLMGTLMNPIKSQGDVPQVRAPGMAGSVAIRWDTGRYIIDAGRPGADATFMAGQMTGPYSVYDERPGGQWFVPGMLADDGMWPS